MSKYLDKNGLNRYDEKIKEHITAQTEKAMSITSGGRSSIGTSTETGYMRIKDGAHAGTEQINLMYNLATSDNTLSLMYETSGDFEHDREFIIPTTDYVDSKVGDLTALTTTDKNDVVSAINEVKFTVDGLGEPYRLKDFTQTFTTALTIPSVTQDIDNTSIPNVDIAITGQEATDFAIAGLLKYEVFDASNKRLNCFPVCAFSMDGQKTLRVRMMVGGPNSKQAKKISGAILLKHR